MDEPSARNPRDDLSRFPDQEYLLAGSGHTNRTLRVLEVRLYRVWKEE
jgi:hypothetical protein